MSNDERNDLIKTCEKNKKAKVKTLSKQIINLIRLNFQTNFQKLRKKNSDNVHIKYDNDNYLPVSKNETQH